MIAKILSGICIIGFDLIFVPVTRAETCWDTTWYNNSSPSGHDGSEYETLNITVMNSICQGGKPVIAIHCKSNQEQPFEGFKNDTASKYIAICTVVNGLQCHPYNNTAGASCADFAIQYGCYCTITTSPPAAFQGASTSEQRASVSKTSAIGRGSSDTTTTRSLSVKSTSEQITQTAGSGIDVSTNSISSDGSTNGLSADHTGYISDGGSNGGSNGSGSPGESIRTILGRGSTENSAIGCCRNGSQTLYADIVALFAVSFYLFYRII